MEADWSAEVGFNLPSIDLPWEGFVDLRNKPAAVEKIDETAGHPALREAILRLNAKESPVFTTKCDLWTLERSAIDPDEFGARREDAREGLASYIDLLQLDLEKFSSFEFHERWLRRLTENLRSIALSNGRVDFVIRAASNGSHPGYGITLYAAGCGADASAAYAAWETVLRAAVTATMNQDILPPDTGE